MSYRPDHGDFIVLLDGARVPHVISADVKRGLILYEPVDETGAPIRVGDEICRIYKAGRVEIVPVAEYLNLIGG